MHESVCSVRNISEHELKLAFIQASSISCIIAFLKYVRLRFIMQRKDVLLSERCQSMSGFSAAWPLIYELHLQWSFKSTWWGVMWPAWPLRSRETAWGQREGPFSDRQITEVIYNDGGQRQRVWRTWFYTLNTHNLIPDYTLHKVISLTKK